MDRRKHEALISGSREIRAYSDDDDWESLKSYVEMSGSDDASRALCRVERDFSEAEEALVYYEKVVVPAILKGEMMPRLRERLDEDLLLSLFERQDLRLEDSGEGDESDGQSQLVVLNDVLNKPICYEDRRFLEMDIELKRAELLLSASVAYGDFYRQVFWNKLVTYFVLCAATEDQSEGVESDGPDVLRHVGNLKELFYDGGSGFNFSNDILRRLFEKDPELVIAISTVLMEMDGAGNMPQIEGEDDIDDFRHKPLSEVFAGFDNKTNDGIGYFNDVEGGRERAVAEFHRVRGLFSQAAEDVDKEQPPMTREELRAALARREEENEGRIGLLESQLKSVKEAADAVLDDVRVAASKERRETGTSAVENLEEVKRGVAEKAIGALKEDKETLWRDIYSAVEEVRWRIENLESLYYRWYEGGKRRANNAKLGELREVEKQLVARFPEIIEAGDQLKQRREESLTFISVTG